MAFAAGAHQVGGGVLHPDDVGVPGQPRDQFHADLDDGARRDVVEDDRDVDRIGHRHEVAILPFLRRLVVIACHRQHGIGTHRLGELGQFDGFDGGIAARARDHRHAACGFRDADLDHPAMLVMGQGRRFAGGATGNQAVGAFGDLPRDQLAESGLVQLAVLHRGDESGNRAFNAVGSGHGVFPVGLIFVRSGLQYGPGTVLRLS